MHADPPLDLVAAFTLGSTDGPLPDHVPLIQQLKANYNDDTKLILFHSRPILDGSLGGGQLPITIWESFYEPGTESADKGLQVDGWGVGTQLQLKFRQVPFEVETEEAEMIGVDYVAKGAANANVTADSGRKASTAPSLKGKEKARGSVADGVPAAQHVLTAEDEECEHLASYVRGTPANLLVVIASLTSKSDAIKMLHARLNLIKQYLSTLPPSYLSDPTLPPAPGVNHVLLRQISSLLSRLPLLSPPSLSSTSDVELVTLLSTLTSTLAATRELNTKSTVVTRARTDKRMASMARDLDPQGFGGGRGKGAPRSYGNGGIGGGGGDLSQLDAGFDSGADAGDY